MIELIKSLSLFEIDGYIFQEKLDGGSAASAIYANGEEKVVFKFLIAPRNKQEKLRFEREFLSLSRNFMHILASPAGGAGRKFFGPETSYPLLEIVHDMKSDFDDSVLYFSYKYVSGKLLRDINVEDLSMKERYEVLHRVASGLSYFSQSGYSHRDLHPGNILLCEGYCMDNSDDPEHDPRVKVLDMGSCVKSNEPRFYLFDVVDEEQDKDTDSGRRLIASFYSMPPDFVTQGNKVRNYDTWAFGVLAFNFLCGTHPYDLEDLSDVYDLYTGKLAEYKDNTRLLSKFPTGIECIIKNLLSVSGEKRIAINEVVRIFHLVVNNSEKLDDMDYVKSIINNNGFDPNVDPLDFIY